MASGLTKRLTEADFWGPEPSWIGTPTPLQVIKALNWYSALKTPEDGLTWLVEYLTKIEHPLVNEIRLYVPSMWMPTTLGWIARLMLRDLIITRDLADYFSRRLPQVVEECKRRRPIVVNQTETSDSVDFGSEPKQAPEPNGKSRVSPNVDQLSGKRRSVPKSGKRRPSSRKAA